ncbi:MAG: HAD family hydrolase [Rikenellaceae bacterium]
MSKAVLLDRDGTINVDHGYLHDKSLLEFLPGAIEALQRLSAADFKLIIITNQSGIGRGYFSKEQYEEFNEELVAVLKSKGVEIAATYMCPHSPIDNCHCRKPYPYMALKAIEQFEIDPTRSYMLGDKGSDVECGEAAGVTARLIDADHNLLYWANEIIDNRL